MSSYGSAMIKHTPRLTLARTCTGSAALALALWVIPIATFYAAEHNAFESVSSCMPVSGLLYTIIATFIPGLLFTVLWWLKLHRQAQSLAVSLIGLLVSWLPACISVGAIGALAFGD